MDLARLAGVSADTINRARAALGLPEPHGRHARDRERLAAGTEHAVTFLRSCLSLHPVPASEVEERASRSGIGSRALEIARNVLKVRVERSGDGQGVCYYLPKPESLDDCQSTPRAPSIQVTVLVA